VDAVRIQKDAQAESVYDARLKKEPRAFTSSRAACLKGQRNQVLWIDDAHGYPFVLMHSRRVNRIYDEGIVRRQNLNRDTVDEHVLGVNREALRLGPAVDWRQRDERRRTD